MTARQVHAVIAAGVEDPSLLARWLDEPERLRRQGVDPAAFDLIALRKFAGMTVKVRHNGLRHDLPLTFRLLNVTGQEIEVFSAYATHRAADGAGYAPTTEGRTRDFMAFLDTWLDRARPEHVMLWDLIRHEHALAQVRRASSASSTKSVAASAAAVPHVCGAVILHEMQCDPRAVAAALHESRPPFGDIAFETRYVCYWNAGGDRIRIIDLDAFGYYALSLVDDVRSVADLSEAMGGKRRPSRAFLQLLGQLGQAGILRYDKSAVGGRRSAVESPAAASPATADCRLPTADSIEQP
jgi:hypothetical protein